MSEMPDMGTLSLESVLANGMIDMREVIQKARDGDNAAIDRCLTFLEFMTGDIANQLIDDSDVMAVIGTTAQRMADEETQKEN